MVPMASRLTAYAIVFVTAVTAAVLFLPAPAYSHKPITTNVLFKNEIAQIFQRKCFQCHTENNIGVALTTYTEARPWARAIREEILDRRMPPWTAVSGYGHFSNDISLNTRETEIILSWTDGGTPSGVLKAEEPIPPVYVPPAPEWNHGTPDQVLPIGTGHLIEASAPFHVQRFVVSTGFSSPKRVRAIALKQGDRRVVRHAAFYERATGRWLGSWTPWQTVTTLPDGAAHRLAARAEIVVEVGYTGAEEPVTDRSDLGLYFGTGTGRVVDTLKIRAADVPLVARAASHRVRTEMKIGAPVSAVALWPDPGPGVRSIEITATSPEGISIPLLWIKDYRPEWRSPYFLSTPIPLSRGARVVMTAYFDNPSDEPDTARAQAWMVVTPN